MSDTANRNPGKHTPLRAALPAPLVTSCAKDGCSACALLRVGHMAYRRRMVRKVGHKRYARIFHTRDA